MKENPCIRCIPCNPCILKFTPKTIHNARFPLYWSQLFPTVDSLIVPAPWVYV